MVHFYSIFTSAVVFAYFQSNYSLVLVIYQKNLEDAINNPKQVKIFVKMFNLFF